MHRPTSLFSICLFLLALPLVAQAQAGHHDSEHSLHHHHLSFFSGATSEFGEPGASSNRNTWHTIGLDYEYRINHLFGVSVFAEYLFASHEEFLLGLPVYVHPWHGLKLNVSPLLALVYESEESDEHKTWHNKFGYRIEAGYDFLFDHYSITPIINFDRVDGHPEINYGVAFGVGF